MFNETWKQIEKENVLIRKKQFMNEWQERCF